MAASRYRTLTPALLAGLLVVLGGTPAPSAAAATRPLQLASPGFSSVNMDKALVDFAAEHFAQQLDLAGLRTVTAGQMGALLGLERQKQLLGCSEESSSCLAELANALGADGVVTGALGRFGEGYQVNLRVLSARDATLWSATSFQAASDAELLAGLTRAARRMAIEVLEKNGRPVPAALRTSPAAAPAEQVAVAPLVPAATQGWPLWPTLGGGALTALGGFLLVAAWGNQLTLEDADPTTFPEARTAAEDGKSFQTAGLVTTGLGVALLGYAAWSAAQPVRPAAPLRAGPRVGPGQLGVVVEGVLP